MAATEGSLCQKDPEDGSNKSAGDFLNRDTTKKNGCGEAAENGRAAMMHPESSPTQSEKRRSIQFSDPEVVNRTYESVDEVMSKISFYKRPATAQLPPTPGTGPPRLAAASEMGIRPPQLGMESLPAPPHEQRKESVDEYVVMAPSLPR